MLINFKTVINKIKKYISNAEDLILVEKAYKYALKKHQNQFRKSKEPYIQHPLWVTYFLASWFMDVPTLVAGLLHDVLEDTPTTFEEIESNFSNEIATLIQAVTKVSYFAKKNRSEVESNYLRKLYLSMARDIRVILIKLADRLHNMKTISYLSVAKQKIIAKETLEVYTLIAHRLGMQKLKSELEDLSFPILKPKEYKKISSLVEVEKQYLKILVGNMIDEIKSLLKSKKIKSEIYGRHKTIYSIYRKMYIKGYKFEDIHDLLAIRIIVNSIDDCYSGLGHLHQQYPPLSGRFKDYIATPKHNFYQSLHTTIINNAAIFEVQIRTWKMEEQANFGAASHWKYKEGEDFNTKKKQADIDVHLDIFNRILTLENIHNEEIESKTKNKLELTIKNDIFTSSIYVLTPNNKVVTLPYGSTILDFAYKIHTNIGETTVGAQVNNNYVPINTVLKSGDIVAIKTQKNMHPSRDWLLIAKTSYALHKIKSFLKKQEKETLDSNKEKENRNFKKIKEVKKNLEELIIQQKLQRSIASKKIILTRLKDLKYNNLEDFYLDIANGLYILEDGIKLITINNDNKTYLSRLKEKKITKVNLKDDVIVKGVNNIDVDLAYCCLPLPYEPIIGYVISGKKIKVHRQFCLNIKSSLKKEKTIFVNWNKEVVKQSYYLSSIEVSAVDRPGLMVNITTVLANLNASIEQVNSNKKLSNQFHFTISFIIKVLNYERLMQVISSLKQIPDVNNVIRLFN